MKLGPKATFLLRVAFAVAFSILLAQVKLEFLEAYLYDLRFRLRPTSTVSGQVEIVLIDQKTVEHFKRIPGYADHELVVRSLLAQEPKALIYVTPLAKATDAEEDGPALSSPSGDLQEGRSLAELLEKSPFSYQVTDRMFLKGENKTAFLPVPFDRIKPLSAPKTADSGLFAKDGVTRRVLIDYQGEPLGHLLIATGVNPELKDRDHLSGQFPVYETNQAFVDFQPNGSFRTTKFEDFVRQSVDLAKFKNKVILIGDDLGKSLKSYVKTPYSRDPSAMTLVEMHANMFDTLIRNAAPIQAPPWVDLLLTSLISLFTLYIVLTLRPLKGMGLLVVSAFALSFFGFLLFWPFGLVISMAHPLIAIFLCYYFFIPYRLIIENRRSWEYQQKNRLLSQVEELKTNFISMMSHDLRTPIARIQGMTDVILKDNVTLSPTQREALDHIRSSGDDLLKFFNSILNYARIESQGVELHLQSRDVNQILEEVLKKNEFLAKLKHIQLISELEPQFPIPMDPDLIRQVFSNLVENAIKYSPENSKVLISSEEASGFVRVQVADQGHGIPPQELPHIFMKFFRSANAKSSPIKGSGLGLYLARYFVEMHKGRIWVESTLDQGSTFTVELPLSR